MHMRRRWHRDPVCALPASGTRTPATGCRRRRWLRGQLHGHPSLAQRCMGEETPAPTMPPTTIVVRVGNGSPCWAAVVLNAPADATAASSAERGTTLLLCVVHTTGALGSPGAPLDCPGLSRGSQAHHACDECDRSGYKNQFTHYCSFRSRHRRLPLSLWVECVFGMRHDIG
jgi:hypothetical protein